MWLQAALRFAAPNRQSHSIDVLLDRAFGLAPCNDSVANTLSWGIGSQSKSRPMRRLDGEVENAESRASLLNIRPDSASGYMDQMARHSPAKIHLEHATPQESFNRLRKWDVSRSGRNGHGRVHRHWIRKAWLQRWQMKVCFQSSNSPGQVVLLNW